MATKPQDILFKALMVLLTHKPHAVSKRLVDWRPELHGLLGHASGHVHYCDRVPGIQGILASH